MSALDNPFKLTDRKNLRRAFMMVGDPGTATIRNFGCLRVALLDDHQANIEIMPELKGPEQRLNK
jgi:hypothetical protein